MLTLLKNGNVYSPTFIGKKDILISGNKIIAIEDGIDALYTNTTVIDLDGKNVLPGLIDQHVHLIGGGGEDGYSSLIPELQMTDLVKYGVTSVVGLLGTDSHVKSVKGLVAKCKALKERGMSAWCLTGSYALPSVTVTGNVGDDIAFVEEIIGVKVAISDQRSSQPSKDELKRLASYAYTAGLLSHKAGVVHMHMGRSKKGLDDILELLDDSDLLIQTFRPTHIGNCLESGVKFASRGGIIDFTAGDKTVDQILSVVDKVPLAQMTMSSDANGSFPKWNETHTQIVGMGIGKCETLWQTIQKLVMRGMSLENAIQLCTSNVANALSLENKGKVKVGYDADLLVVDETLKIQNVITMGKIVVDNGKCIVKNYYD